MARKELSSFLSPSPPFRAASRMPILGISPGLLNARADPSFIDDKQARPRPERH